MYIATSSMTFFMRGVAMRGEVLGVERRRRRDDQVKLAMVSAVEIDGATVIQVAQRHEVSRQQIYARRHELERKVLWSSETGALFILASLVLAMELTMVSHRTPAFPSVVWVELRLGKGRVFQVESDIDDAALSHLICAVDAA